MRAKAQIATIDGTKKVELNSAELKNYVIKI